MLASRTFAYLNTWQVLICFENVFSFQVENVICQHAYICVCGCLDSTISIDSPLCFFLGGYSRLCANWSLCLWCNLKRNVSSDNNIRFGFLEFGISYFPISIRVIFVFSVDRRVFLHMFSICVYMYDFLFDINMLLNLDRYMKS